ncbi:MAG TPA: acetyl-CoA decarbonylase/synthase complex subunit gamma [Dehalococcoidia bacterium]|nr:acetyl-CoA decarbonylase/synthase complex subunit gamma [Dehalococcoidia bacterium]
MALTGIQIYKYLPKTNCKECGQPTCLAFAMKLAASQAELSACPYVSAESKQALAAASKPPIRLVTVGAGDKKIEVGNETVLFRHDKTFVHKPGLVIRVKDSMPLDQVTKLVGDVSNYKVDRVGITFGMDGIAVQNDSGNAATFAKCVEAVAGKTDLPLVLIATNPDSMSAALEKVSKAKPAIYAANKENIDKMIELAKKYACPLAVQSSDGLNELAELTEKAAKAGVADLIMDPGVRGFGDTLVTLTQLRRLALNKRFEPLGYPIITFPGEGTASAQEEAVLAGQHIAKYGGIIVLDHFSPAIAYALVTLRLNVYTDPQKPIQMKPGLYQILEPKPTSPLCVTTNFSLTYFSIAGELEAAGWASWLLVCDTEGLSVLTAWSAGKFDADKIAKTVKAQNAAEKVTHRNLVIPGGVAVLRGELEEALPDWKIMVGPREAMAVGSYLKEHWKV